MLTCIRSEHKYDALSGDPEERMCEDCLYQNYCEHDNEEYQAAEPENNVIEGMVWADCGIELPIPEPNYGYS